MGCDAKTSGEPRSALGKEAPEEPYLAAAVTGSIRSSPSSPPSKSSKKTLSQVFQAIRMSVNDELGQLEAALAAAARCLHLHVFLLAPILPWTCRAGPHS